jgi:hypothetical protein
MRGDVYIGFLLLRNLRHVATLSALSLFDEIPSSNDLQLRTIRLQCVEKSLLTPVFVAAILDVRREVLNTREQLPWPQQVSRQSLKIQPVKSAKSLALEPEVEVESVNINNYTARGCGDGGSQWNHGRHNGDSWSRRSLDSVKSAG